MVVNISEDIINQKNVKNKITDIKNTNLFGIHLHTHNALSEFQKKSGMEGPYTVEYQHHYWAAVGRMYLDGQILDVCIPLVMFNYPQKVSGASIKFDLREVNKMSDQLSDLATAKFNEMMTKFGKELSEKALPLTWDIVPLMTMHVHPGSLSTFSGTDYDKNIDNPGVVYPLSEGENQASFSSIMGHKKSSPFLMRTEYRLFSGEENGDKKYKYGRCISYVKRDIKENGPIEAMFIGNKIKEGSYTFKDGFVNDEGDELMKMITDIFENSDYEPDTSFILKENIKKITTMSRTVSWGNSNTKSKKRKYLNLYDIEDYTPLEIQTMRDFLIETEGFAPSKALTMSEDDVFEFYMAAVEKQEEDKKKDMPKVTLKEPEPTLRDTKTQSLFESEEDEIEKKFRFLIMSGFPDKEILKLTDDEIEDILYELEYDLKDSTEDQ
jgi:hypothetical protein